KPLTRFEKPHQLCHASFCDPYYQYCHAGFSNLWVRVRLTSWANNLRPFGTFDMRSLPASSAVAG
ncbi:MAG: hypothetical protein ACYTF1_13535, partial [Planctomycetota bacterium]